MVLSHGDKTGNMKFMEGAWTVEQVMTKLAAVIELNASNHKNFALNLFNCGLIPFEYSIFEAHTS